MAGFQFLFHFDREKGLCYNRLCIQKYRPPLKQRIGSLCVNVMLLVGGLAGGGGGGGLQT